MIKTQNKSSKEGNLYLIAKTSILLLIVVVVTYIVSLYLGNSQAGFQNQTIFNTQTYYSFGYAFIFCMIFGLSFGIVTRYRDDTYGNSISFANLGDFPAFKIFKRFSMLQFAWLCLIIIIAFYAFIIFIKPQTTFTGVLPQQFTPGGKTIYDTTLIPGAENLGLAAIFIVIIVPLGIFARKKNWSKTQYRIMFLVLITLVSALFGWGNHQLNPIYQNSEVNSGIVALYWGAGGLINGVTGYFVPFWIMHTINNLTLDLQGLLSSDLVRIYMITVDFFLLTGYWIVYRGRFFGTAQPKVIKQENVIYN